MISEGRPALGVSQTCSTLVTFHAPPLFCRKNALGPGFTRAAAHIVGEAIAHWNLTMADPEGSAARMEASVHSPAAWVADETPDDLAFDLAFDFAFAGAFVGASKLDGVPLDGGPWVGVADLVASLEDEDEQPVIKASPVPPAAKRIAALLTVV